jgi:hypothetical protein
VSLGPGNMGLSEVTDPGLMCHPQNQFLPVDRSNNTIFTGFLWGSTEIRCMKLLCRALHNCEGLFLFFSLPSNKG